MLVNPLLAMSVMVGLATGGMFVFYLITDHERTRRLFSLLTLCFTALSFTILLLGTDFAEWGRASLQVLLGATSLLLSFFLGYAVTAYFVLGRREDERNTARSDLDRPAARPQVDQLGKLRPAVIYYATAEPEGYQTRQQTSFYNQRQAQGLPTPLTLLRPFAMSRLRDRYAALGQSPQRHIQTKVAQKVQERLGRRYRVYLAFSDDHPWLEEIAATAVADGYQHLIVVRPRLAAASGGERTAILLRGLNLEEHGVAVRDAPPLANAEPLLRGLVRRISESAHPQQGGGVLLLTQAHPEEQEFEQLLCAMLIESGYQPARVATAMLHQLESITAACRQLAAAGATHIVALPVASSSDSLTTLYDIPRQITATQQRAALTASLTTLGGWNDDEGVITAIVDAIKAVMGENDGSTSKPDVQPVYRASQV